MSLFTLKTDKIVVEDLALGTGTTAQERGIGTQISAATLPYNNTKTIAEELDSKAAVLELANKAELGGSATQIFKVATAIVGDDAVSLAVMNEALTTKADVADMNLKAAIVDVLTLANTTPYTPSAEYHPATKKYVDDTVTSIGAGDMSKAIYDANNNGVVDSAEGIGLATDELGVTPHNQVMRLAQFTLTDCNAVDNFGIFVGVDVTNAPVSGVIGLEQLDIPGLGKAQRCFSFTSKAEYFRTYQGTGPWTIWERSTSQSDIVNSLLGSTNPYKVLHADQGRLLNEMKSDIGHGHTISDILNLQSTLDSKASLIHTHAIADVTGLQSVLNTKVGTSLVAFHVVTGASQTSIDFSGLDILADGGEYQIVLQQIGGSTGYVYAFINGDTTLTNYRSQYLQGNGATPSSARQSNPSMHYGYSSFESSCIANLELPAANTRPTILSRSLYSIDSVTPQVADYAVLKSATVTNITQLTLVSSVANGFAVGTVAKIYKRV